MGDLGRLRVEWLRGARRDIFLGDRDANAIDGTAGDDEISGFAGDDTLAGGAGHDRIAGGAGADSLRGGRGDDTLFGRADYDSLDGGNGDDLLDGGSGRDLLRGGLGADTLIGGNGHDRLVGGDDDARDVFVFDNDAGHDRIRGFDAWRDVIQATVLDVTAVTVDDITGVAVVQIGRTLIRIGGVFDTELLIDFVGVDDGPVVKALDLGSVSEDATGGVWNLLFDQRDPEGDALAVEGGTVTLLDGAGETIPAGDPLYVDVSDFIMGDELRFDPSGFDKLAAGASVTVHVRYTVGTGGGGVINTADLVVAGSNDGPTMADGTLAVAETDAAATLDLATLGDDIDLDDGGGSLTYTLDQAVAGASISGTTLTIDGGMIAGDVPAHGTVDVDVGIVATDRHGETASGTVTVSVTSPNRGPVAVDDGPLEAEADAATTIRIADLLGNDTDADGDTLTLSSLDLSGTSGTVVDNGDGTLTYDPDGAFDTLPLGGSATDSFSYTVGDGHGGTDTATVDLAVSNTLDSFTGSTVSYTHRFPNLDTVNSQQTIAVDDDGVTFAYRAGSGVSAFVTIDDGQIILSTTAANIGFSQPLPKPPGFHGFRIEDVSDMIDDIVGVTAGAGSVAFDAGRVTFTEDSVTFELGNLSLASNQRVVLDIEFA